MSITGLILAAGEQVRWKMTEPPYHKQLLDVGGETIIERIWRQCRARGTEPAVITHKPELFAQILYKKPERRRWTVETLLSTYDLWQERVIVLLGDVVYSRAVMDRIFAPHQEPLKVYGNQYEIYAASFNEPYNKIVNTLEDAIVHAESGIARGGGKLRKFYQAYCGLNMTGNERENKVLNWVDDYTQDVDNSGEYVILLNIVRNGILDDLPEGDK